MTRALDLAAGMHWAITEPSLRQLFAIAQRHGDPKALEAFASDELDGAERATVRDGVAIIQVRGPLFRYANLFTRISGATSYETTARDLTVALNDPHVHSILLNIDSPGGEVNGANELAEMIYAARDVKPVTAYVNMMGASGAYWIASAASRIVADETAMLGSIGVIWVALDTSKADEKAGLREIVIVSDQSPHKDTDPATDDGFDRMRALATQLASVFIRSVARNRGVSEEHVVSEFGRGFLRSGQAVLDAGLADAFGSYESVLADMAAEHQPARLRATTTTWRNSMGAQASAPAAGQDQPVTYTQEQFNAAIEAARADERSKLAAQVETARTEATAKENKRIADIEALAVPGAEAVIKACKADTAVTPEMAAIKIVQAQQQQGASALKTMQDDENALETPGAGAHAGVEGRDPVKVAQGAIAAARKAGVLRRASQN